jgi:ariadne-1
MDSDDEIGIDSGNVSSEEEDNYDFMEVDAIQRSSTNHNESSEYPFEVLTTEEIVQHMLDCIKEVTNVVEVSIINDKTLF